MKNLLAITANHISTGASICRVNSVKTLRGVTPTITNSPTWQQLSDADIVLVHRPVNESDHGIVSLAKKSGKKIWLDLDDDYFHLPKDHISYPFYQDPTVISRLQKTIAMADVVTVSNDLLKESFSPYFETSKMVTTLCSYDTTYLKNLKKDYAKREKRVCWRGSQTHWGSLFEYGPEIVALSKEHPDWEWYFLGDSPWMFSEQMEAKKVVVNQNFISPDILLEFIQGIQPALQIMPLSDNHFTRCRSNMAWMDGLTGGAITVAPNWPNWKVPGVINYEEKADFKVKASQFMSDIERGKDFSKVVAQAWEHLLDNYTFEAVNKIQETILESL